MVNQQGWIRLHRKFDEWEWRTDPKTVSIFLYLLLNANHQDGRWKGIEVKRGQLITGRNKVCLATGVSEQSYKTSIKRLKSTNEITIKSTKQYSIITICKYDTYQSGEGLSNQEINQGSNQQVTNKQPTSNQQVTTNKNDNKDKNDKNDKKTYPVDAFKFVEFWKTLMPVGFKYPEGHKTKYLDLYDKLVRIDGYKKDEIFQICQKAREDDFWSKNFMSPIKLRNKDKNGITYYEVFKARFYVNETEERINKIMKNTGLSRREAEQMVK